MLRYESGALGGKAWCVLYDKLTVVGTVSRKGNGQGGSYESAAGA